MIKIKLEPGAEVHFPNLGTSVFMHESGLTVLDRCGEQPMGELVLQNGVSLKFKGNVLHIKEPYNWKVTVAVSGYVEIEADYLTHQVSGMQASRTGFYHPDRGHLRLQVDDVFEYKLNMRNSFKLIATTGGVAIESVGSPTVLELE